MRKLKGLLTAMLLLFAQFVLAQNRELVGKVTDSKEGNPLPGVSVTIKNSDKGTVTGSDGSFKIVISSNNTILVFSGAGFTPKEVRVGNIGVLNISLDAVQKVIEEVVVTGYTQQTRRQSTSSIAKVSGDAVKTQPIGSFEQMLQGKASGILIQSQSGQPGSAASVTIRGKSSINGSTTPLYIVDGIQIGAGDFSTINPGDIESFNVLKDAVATSLYGSRGANGVVVVTTRRGKSGQTKVSYDFQYGVGELPKNRLELMNSAEKINYELNYNRPGGLNPFGWSAEEADSLSKVPNQWRDALFRDNVTQQHQINVSGGNERTRFFISGSIFDQQGVVKTTYLKRYTGRINIDNTFGAFKVDVKAFLGYSRFSGVSENDQYIGSPLNALRWTNPYVTPKYPDGSYNLTDLDLQGQPNALQILEQNYSLSEQVKGIGSISLEYRFPKVKGLVAKTNWGADYTSNEGQAYTDRDNYVGQQSNGGNGSFSRSYDKLFRYTGTTSLSYATKFGKIHDLRLSAFTEVVNRKTNSFGFIGYGLTGPLKNETGITPGTPTNNYIPGVFGSPTTPLGLVSYFGVLDYTLNKKYILTANFRRDGSSRFSKEQRWSNFGGVGVSWIASDEDFIRKVKWVNDLKFRASYGSTGNQSVGSDFVSRELYSTTSYNGNTGIINSQLPNPNLTWESRITFNGGMDFTVLKNRLSGTIEYYNSASKNLLNSQPLSQTTGWSAITTNTGNIVNAGIEVTLNATIVKMRNFNWDLSANYTYNKSKVKSLIDDKKEDINGIAILRVGERVNSIYLVQFAGVNPDNGNSLYYKPDGKTTTEVYSPDDRVIVGVFDPPHFGGFTNTVNYKGLELSVLFTYMFGHHIFNVDRTNVENPIYYYSGVSKALLTEWQKPGDITNIPRPGQLLRSSTTRFLEKGDFIRLRNVKLSYNLPQSMLNKFHIQSMNIYLQGQNLYSWNKFQGYDPEVATGVLVGSQYPQLKTYSLGINIGF